MCVAEKAPVVTFFWDDPPDEWPSRLRAVGTHIWFQVGSVAEVKAALRRGAQALVVQGSEAGGHNRAGEAAFSLLPAVIDAVDAIPVNAAGGIADGRTVAAALALVPRPSGWGPASSRVSRPTHTRSTRIVSSQQASRILRAILSLVRSFPTPPLVGCATALCGNGSGETIRRDTRSLRTWNFRSSVRRVFFWPDPHETVMWISAASGSSRATLRR